MPRLTRLVLTDFRNYAALTWRPEARVSVLYGPNGSGKTNLLEALSLLVPGRGLRGARHADLPRQGGSGAWAVAARLAMPDGDTEIGTGTPPGGTDDRRVFRLDGATPRSQAEVARRLSAVWLTPRMDRLFQEGLSGRRRFLDRLVWAMEPGHAREMAAHDTAVANRNRLLAEGRRDRAWLAAVEDAIARHAVAATAARMALVNRLNDQATFGFPRAHIALDCPIAERLAREPALAVEDWLRAELESGRGRDAGAGAAALGAHRTDMRLTDAATGLAAGLASTGQQKALLIGVVLSHAGLIAAARGAPPLLLLDEPAVHLDTGRRQALWEALAVSPAQTVVTGTDADIFLPLAGQADAYATGDGALHRDTRFRGEVPVPRAL
ncbi:DNA replication/repair protein RecF [Rhodopila sp.]|uniref:DNA replication/repair protein RecF n=1 Tax=Rhodopila sp. TaxID=2480087 RepID=UPI002BB2F573|nr:DNA replication/repair protein RecF [Rhodopila sp.]HVZ10241.1 DNA replication/repair protein RecF [Rhodopila sp.]